MEDPSQMKPTVTNGDDAPSPAAARHPTGPKPGLAPTRKHRTKPQSAGRPQAIRAALIVAMLSAGTMGVLWFVAQDRNARLERALASLREASDAVESHSSELASDVGQREGVIADLRADAEILRGSRRELLEQAQAAVADRNAAQANERGETQRAARADEQRRRAEHAAYALQVSGAIRALEDGDPPGFVRSLDQAEILGGGWEIDALRGEFDQSLLSMNLGEFGATASAIMPDGRRILVGDNAGGLRFVDPVGRLIEEPFVGDGGAIERITVANDAARAATLDRGGRVLVWDIERGVVLAEHLIVANIPSAIALSASGQWLAVGDVSGRVSIREASTGDPIAARRPHQTSVQTLAFSPDDLWLISCSSDRDVARISSSGWVVRPSETFLDGVVRSLAFAGRSFFTGDDSGGVIEWSVDDHQPVRVFQREGRAVLALAESGGVLAGGTAGFQTLVWWPSQGAGDLARAGRDAVVSRMLTGHTARVSGVAWIKGDPLALLTIDEDHVARVWRLETTSTDARSPALHDAEIVAIASTLDSSLIFTGSRDGSIRTWNAADLTPYESAPVLELGERPISLGLSAESAFVLDASGAIRRWDPHSGSILATRIMEGAMPRALAIRERDALLIVGDDAGTIHLLDGESLRTIREIPAHEGAINDIAISADGQRVLSVADDGAIVWELARFDPVLHLGPFAHRPVVGAIDRRGTSLVIGDDAGFIHVHGIPSAAGEGSGARRHDPRWSINSGIGPAISALAFSPDGTRIVSSDRAGVCVLWATAYEQPIARLAHGPLPIGSLHFLSDDERLFAGLGDGRLRVWWAGVEPAIPDPEPGAALAIVNAAIIDAFAASPTGERIVPRAGEPFSIGVRFRTIGLAGEVVEITRSIGESMITSRESAGSDETSIGSSVSGAWIVDQPGVFELTVRVRTLAPREDQVLIDDSRTVRFRVRP